MLPDCPLRLLPSPPPSSVPTICQEEPSSDDQSDSNEDDDEDEDDLPPGFGDPRIITNIVSSPPAPKPPLLLRCLAPELTPVLNPGHVQPPKLCYRLVQEMFQNMSMSATTELICSIQGERMWLLGRFLRITASFVPDILRVSAFTLVEERTKIHAAMAKARSMPNGIYHTYNASPLDIANIKRRKTNLDKVFQKTKDTKPPPDATASLCPKSQFDKDAILKR